MKTYTIETRYIGCNRQDGRINLKRFGHKIKSTYFPNAKEWNTIIEDYKDFARQQGATHFKYNTY